MVLEVLVVAVLKGVNILAIVNVVKPAVYKMVMYALLHTFLIVLIYYCLLRVRAVLVLFITITVFIVLVLIKVCGVTRNGVLKREMFLYKERKIYLWVTGRDFSP